MAASQAQWILGICTVVFDVDVGQKINNIVPSGILSEEEQKAVAFHAFPDSMSMELHSRSSVRDSSFFFRIRRQAAGQEADAAQLARRGFLHGFVFCRQRQDEALRRGGEQNSVVVLSEHPFSSALLPLSQIAGPLYFNQGPAALQQVYREVGSWPVPLPGVLLQLPVAMSTIPTRLPAFRTFPPPAPEVDAAAVAASSSLHRRTSHNHLPRTRSTDSTGSARSAHNSAQLPAVASPVGLRSTRTLSEELQLDQQQGQQGQGKPSVQIPNNTYMLRDPALDASPLQMRAVNSWDSTGTPGSPVNSSEVNVVQDGSNGAASGSMRRTSSLKRGSSSDHVKEELAGVFSEVDVYTPLAEQLGKLWQLWEMVLTCQPLLVVAPSPGDASGCVAALMSLVAPLPYAADFRPYYTLHDPAFRHLQAGELPTPSATSLPCLMGVTNLFFIKALQQWPNILAVGHKEAAGGHWGTAAGGGIVAGAASLLSPAGAVKALKRRQQGALTLVSEHTQALWSSYRPLCRPDQGLLSRLVQPKPSDPKAKLQRAAVVNSTAIRRHFAELTSAFLAPFAPYLEPGAGSGQGQGQARLPRWEPGAFLFSLHTGSHDQVLLERLGGNRASLAALYERFIRSANFASWFEARRRPLEHLIELEPPPGMDAFSSAVHHMDEVQRMQAFFSLEQQLVKAMEAAGAGATTTTTITAAGTSSSTSRPGSSKPSSSGMPFQRDPQAATAAAAEDLALQLQRLRRQASALFCALPEDLQQTLVSSPSRRILLRSLHLDGSLDPVLARLVARLKRDVEEKEAAEGAEV